MHAAIKDVAGALNLKENHAIEAWNFAKGALGVEQPTFFTETLDATTDKRTTFWQERVKDIHWELFDRGIEAYSWYSMEELVKSAKDVALLSGASKGRAIRN